MPEQVVGGPVQEEKDFGQFLQCQEEDTRTYRLILGLKSLKIEGRKRKLQYRYVKQIFVKLLAKELTL